MRQYQYPATDDTVEALRQLRGAWEAYRVESRAFTVWLADGREIRVTVDRADVESDFEAFRLRAQVTADAGDGVWPMSADDAPEEAVGARPAPDFAVSRNDLVLFTGATWVEGPAADGAGDGAGDGAAVGRWSPGDAIPAGAVVQFSGSPRQVSPSAAAVCLSTDAFVVASPVGTGVLVRTGVQPQTLAVTDDAGAIARFLGDRGYGAEASAG